MVKLAYCSFVYKVFVKNLIIAHVYFTLFVVTFYGYEIGVLNIYMY